MRKKIEECSILELGKSFELLLLGLTTDEMLEKAAKKAVEYNMRSLICAPTLVPAAKKLLEGSGVLVGSGCSFPLGRDLPEVKAYTIERAVANGSDDVEIVMNYNALIRGDYNIVEEEIRLIRKAAEGVEFKYILECCQLTDEQMKLACKMAIDGGVDFIKTSTGQLQGPTLEQACLMVDMVKGTKTHSKVSGVKFPKPQNALIYLMAGVECIGSQGCDVILDGIRFMRQRGIVSGSAE